MPDSLFIPGMPAPPPTPQAATIDYSLADAPPRTAVADKKSPDHTHSIGGMDAEATTAEGSPRETLTDDDMAVEYRGLPTH